MGKPVFERCVRIVGRDVEERQRRHNPHSQEIGDQDHQRQGSQKSCKGQAADPLLAEEKEQDRNQKEIGRLLRAPIASRQDASPYRSRRRTSEQKQRGKDDRVAADGRDLLPKTPPANQSARITTSRISSSAVEMGWKSRVRPPPTRPTSALSVNVWLPIAVFIPSPRRR